jgi:subtilisin family serine protease
MWLTYLSYRRKAFLDWKAMFSRVYEHYIPEQLSSTITSVKIAVLDTGIDLDNDYIEVHSGRISGHNWLRKPKSKRINDTHGHGTHIAGLLLDLIPNAEIYVAKVTDGGNTDPEILARVSTTLEEADELL